MKRTLGQQFFADELFSENISSFIPPPDQILDELYEFIPVLYGAFDDANPKAIEFLKKNGKIPKASNHLYPQLIRFLVHNYLHDEGINSQLLNENDEVIKKEARSEPFLPPEILPSNGIAGFVEGYNYRVLKALKGKDKLPPLGSFYKNSPKHEFYCQTHLKRRQLHLIPPKKPHKLTSKPNITFLWEATRSQAINLYLSIPKSGNATKAIAYYTTLIPHPATIIRQGVQEAERLEEITRNTIT